MPVLLVQGINNQCCGMMFGSKGFKAAAGLKMAELEEKLKAASDNGRIPIVTDTSPCLATIKSGLSDGALK
jgi:D-lactate dehydrogenase